MSLESWKAEFYPVPATAATGSDEEAIAHSLRKWEGALPENLAKHCVEYGEHEVIARDVGGRRTEGFLFGGDTCALCERHDDECDACPLPDVGSVSCFDKESAYHVSYDNPLPMITLLRKVHADRGGK